MGTRATVLWCCLGLLFMPAAQNVPVLPTSPSSLSNPLVTSDRPSMSVSPDLLSAVYGASGADPEPTSVPGAIDESTTWLARAIYSETKLPHEQELVAWVIRNRVETGYRGKTTYKEVVLDPYQFSAFNPESPKRSFYASLTPETQITSWQRALWVAYYVRHADPAYRPFSIRTRHFFSEQSMQGRRTPIWARQQQYVSPNWNYQVDERRFRFYKEVS